MADNKKSFFGMNTIAIVTGASRGIGRAIAEEFAKRFSKGLFIVLVGRSEKDLQETVSLIKADPHFAENKTKTKYVVGDLGNTTVFKDVMQNIFQDVDPSQYQHAILVNNAGSLGSIEKYIRDYTVDDIENLQSYAFLNINSPFLLSSKFLEVFTDMKESEKVRKLPTRQTIVQITSLSALVPAKCWSSYCFGKAARDMIHMSIAKEQPGVRVLNYSPGPVNTDMIKLGIEKSGDADHRESLKESLRTIGFQPHETVTIMCDTLEKDEYENGAHVDVFDIIGPPRKDS